MFEVTPWFVKSLIKTIDQGLCAGLGRRKKGEEQGHMCVQAAVSYALGEEHYDRPTCVHEEVRIAGINLNDRPWTSDAMRAKGFVVWP